LGTSLYASFSCLNEGLVHGLITVASYYLGRKNPHYFSSISKSSLMVLTGILVFLSFFLLFSPRLMISTLFPHSLTAQEMSLLIYSCYGLWFFFLCEGLSGIGFAFLNALKEMKFYFIYTFLTVLFFNYLPFYFAYQIGSWSAAHIWWIMSLPCLASAIAYYFRITAKLSILSTQQTQQKLNTEI
jgi:Na+-driven multidrug efflux pump